jgi:hypothetical protein
VGRFDQSSGSCCPSFPSHPPASAIKLLLVGRDAPPSLVAAVRSAISSVRPEVLSRRLRVILTCDARAELVADGEGMPGPNGTLLVRIESVNLDKEGSHESKSGVRLLDANVKDVAQLDGFLEQTTFADHALVFQDGFTLSGPRTYSLLDGPGAKKISHQQVDWPAGAMDRKFGERGFAFMLCGQELRPGQYTFSNVVHEGAKFRCALNALTEDGTVWTVPLKDGETAALVGILADGSVVGQVHMKDSKAGRLVVWKKGGHSEVFPWLPLQFEGTVDTAISDFSRYASFATDDAKPCHPIERVLGKTCDEKVDGRWFVFDRRSQIPLVNRAFPKNSRAALSPDGNHYASFEANELRIYSLGAFKVASPSFLADDGQTGNYSVVPEESGYRQVRPRTSEVAANHVFGNSTTHGVAVNLPKASRHGR